MSLRSKWLPHPWLSIVLLLTWQLLMNATSAGTLILGAILGWVIPLITHVFWPNPPTLQRPLVLLGFVARVLFDIVIANMQVAKLILGPTRQLQPTFVEYPLQLTHDYAISLLASTISLTPGTVSADLSEDRRTLLIHGLNVTDADELIRTIKQRYETPLLEVFECSRT